MAKESLYSEAQEQRLESYEGLGDKWIKLIDEQAMADVKDNKDFRKVRLLMEVINSTTESIHKAAANKAKAEANKNNEDTKTLIALSLQQLASKKSTQIEYTEKDREIAMDLIATPKDVVDGEDGYGVGFLSISDLKKDNDE